MSNIGYIVKQKVDEKPVNTLPDHNLYWAMVTDPNDVACTPTNPITDLKNRYELQTQLWDAVLHLRQGQYYYPDSSGLSKFMVALENCKNIIHDAPDLTYVKDEGTILRRILSAFSLYPTYVSINRLWGLLAGTQVGYPTAPVETTGFGHITRVPMITLRLPLNIRGGIGQPVSLEDALTQPQWFVENKVIVPKSMSIIHSTDVLFFYVGRRYQTVNIARMALPYNFTNLPMTVTGWESLNEYPVIAPNQIPIMNETFILRSVVLVEKAESFEGKSIIVGSSAMVRIPCDPKDGNMEETCVLYDPQTAGFMYRADNETKYDREHPVKVIPCEQPFNTKGKIASFDERARCRGTIFMYQKYIPGADPFSVAGCN
jgi:hypothetical protein